MIKNQKGITLIALVITIIVLLILAGVAIAMLTGDNGIITNAQKSRSNTTYRTADEQMRLAYMAVRTEIAARLANDTSYEATGADSAEELKEIVTNDLNGFANDKSTWTVQLEKDNTSGEFTGIFMKCEDASILKGTEEKDKKPSTDGKVCGRINLEKRTATYEFDITDITTTTGGTTTNTTTNNTATTNTTD